ncbi:MAG: type III pantothenate kinase [gamma proteobacterium symbiont of Bathyaustriella thionipta]|nr:type III pantothenate kinase [gamma proteobacterium symbiont of Bathyaustriella thionipta]
MLLIDIGNTRIKWRMLKHDSVIAAGDGLTHLGIEAIAENSWQSFSPSRVWVSNVVGSEVAQILQEWVARQWQLAVDFAQTQAEAFGVSCAYSQPENLGVDRWLGLIAAHHLLHTNTLLVSCGSALTLDYLLADGRHQGGLIAPGARMMRTSLLKNTAMECEAFPQAQLQPAMDTASAIQNGVYWTSLAMIETFFKHCSRTSAAPVLLFTGGEAAQLMRLSALEARYEPGLVFSGLQILANGKD